VISLPIILFDYSFSDVSNSAKCYVETAASRLYIKLGHPAFIFANLGYAFSVVSGMGIFSRSLSR
jgi:hypothetical protein